MKALLAAYKANAAAYHTRQVTILWGLCTVAWLLPDPTHTIHLPAAGAHTIVFASILSCLCAACCGGRHVLILVRLTS